MKTWLSLAGVLVFLVSSARAQDPKVIIDKALKALGGAEKISAAKAMTWKVKGTLTFGEGENEFSASGAAQGLDHYRQEFEGEFGGNKFKAITVIAGDKGWRSFGGMTMELTGDALDNEKRNAYLTTVPMNVLPLRDKSFKVEAGGEETVAEKAASILKVTAPDKKTFTISFDNESGLPVKVAADVIGFMGDEAPQEWRFRGYKEMGGLKRATKVEMKRGGMPIIKQELVEFKLLDKENPKLFERPE